MANEIKFSDEELQSLNELSQGYQNIQSAFGQVRVQKIIAQQEKRFWKRFFIAVFGISIWIILFLPHALGLHVTRRASDHLAGTVTHYKWTFLTF